jgi:outer membrane lipase/esterase
MKRSILASVLAFVLFTPLSGARAGYSSLFVFGDSLSDSGNNAVALAPNVTPVPIPGNSFVPIFPYASGNYTNAQVWPQILASSLGLSAKPSLLGGTDYAFGGALTGGSNPIPPSLEMQAALFLSQHGPMIPSDALYIVEGGGENAFQALAAAGGCGGNLACINGVIQSTTAGYVGDIKTIDSELESAGAKNIVVWNVPNIGDTPAVLAEGSASSILRTTFASVMNDALLAAIGSDPEIKLFDDFSLLNQVIADPGAFGLSNVTDACAQFITCDPSKFLFWDGIHPTSAAETIISDAIESLVVPEPSTLTLLAAAFLGFGFVRCAGGGRLCSMRPTGLPPAGE